MLEVQGREASHWMRLLGARRFNMAQETMLFAVQDVLAIAEYVLENWYAIDTSQAP